MPTNQVDRNLLFGFLALQNNFLSRDDLIAAVSAWLVDKSRPFDDILLERKVIAEDEQQLIAALVRKHLQRHGDDAERSLAALSSLDGLPAVLRKMGDTEIEATLAHVSASRPADESQTAQTLVPDGSESDKTRFRILRPHAEGGLGQVFVAQDQELNREVALKEIKLLRADDTASRSRFMLEAEITGGLEHPGIVPVYGLGQYADGRPFYAMRFIRGDSLAEAVDRYYAQPARNNAYDTVEFRKLLGRFIDVCNAIEYAHSRGVLHRDLKPGNIMLGKYGETLVVDWGLAKAKGREEQHLQSGEHSLQPRSGSGSVETLMGSAIGTPAYMSPEQAAGRLDQLGPASDVYSLGATLYYVLTGRTPFDKQDGVSLILRKVQSGDFRSPREINPQVPNSLNAICLKAMRREPHDRYASPLELASDMERFLADEPVAACAEPRLVRARRWLRKHPRSVAAVAATLLVAIASAATISVVVSTKNQQLAHSNTSLAAAAESERQARMDAETKQKEAEQARAEEQRAREQADAARNDLAAASDRAKHTLYARTVSLAHQEWLASNVARATALLNGVDSQSRGWEWEFVNRLCHGGAETLRDMKAIPAHVAMTADGQHVIAAGMVAGNIDDPNIYVWRRRDGAKIATYPLHGMVSPDGRWLAVYGSREQPSVQILDSLTGKRAATIPSGETIAAFSRGSNRFATLPRDKTVRVWEIGQDQPVAVIKEESRRLGHALALSDKGDRIAWRRMDDGALEWRDIAHPEKPLHVVPLGGATRDIPPAFSPDGSFVAVAVERQIALYNTTTGLSAGRLYGHEASVLAMDFSPDGRRLVSASFDGTVRVWNFAMRREMLTLRGHVAGIVYGVYAARFDPTGNWIITGGADTMVKVWDAWAGDVDPARPLEPGLNANRWIASPLSQQSDWLSGHRSMVMDLAISPDGKSVASASTDGTVRLASLDPKGPAARTLKHEPSQSLSAVAFSPDGSLLATGGGGLYERRLGEVCVWDTATGKVVHRFKELGGPVARLAFAGSGRLLAAIGSQFFGAGELMAWDVASENVAWHAEGVQGAIRDMALEPKGAWVATVGHHGQVHLWDVATGARLRSLGEGGRAYVSVAVSPDSQHLALGGFDWSVRILRADDGREVWSQRNHSGAVFDLCFSPNGRRLFSASIDGTTKVWDPKYGDEVLSLESEGAENFVLAIHHLDETLLTGRSDPEVAVYRPRAAAASALASSPDEWKVAFSDTFERAELGDSWNPKSGTWSIDHGALRGVLQKSGLPGLNACMLLPKFVAPSHVDVSFDCWSADPIIMETKLHDTTGQDGVGTLFIGKLASPFNQGDKGGVLLYQSGGVFKQLSARQHDIRLEPSRKYRLRSVRRGDRFQMWVDGVLFLEANISAQLALPDVHLQGSFGDVAASVWIDNVEIRIPDSAAVEQRALAAVTAAFQKHSAAVLAIQALAGREDLPEAERELALDFARRRVTLPGEQLAPLEQWAANSAAEERMAQSALAWLNEQSWSAEQELEVERLRGMLLYRAGQFERAWQVATNVAKRRRKDQGSLHPTDLAVMGLAATKLRKDEEIERCKTGLRELLRCTRWPNSPHMDAWVAEARTAGLVAGDLPAAEKELLESTWEWQRSAVEDSNPDPLVAALVESATVTSGRTAESDALDISLDKGTFAAAHRLWHRGKPSPALRLLREAAQVRIDQDRATVQTKMAWLTPQASGWYDEHWELVRAEDRQWRVQSIRVWRTGFVSGHAKWDVAESGWKPHDDAVERVPPGKQPERSQKLSTAGRNRQALEEAKIWAEAEPASAMAHAFVARLAFDAGEPALMESAARKAAELAPNSGVSDFMRAIAIEMQLADSPLKVFGKPLRVPKHYAPFNPKLVTGLPGNVLAAWNSNSQSALMVVEIKKKEVPVMALRWLLPKSADPQSLEGVRLILTTTFAQLNGCQVVRDRRRKFGEHEVVDVVLEGRGNGAAISREISAAASIPTSQQTIVFDEGERFLVFLLSCPSQVLANRTTELCTILDDLTTRNAENKP